jgi:hypothetical protein
MFIGTPITPEEQLRQEPRPTTRRSFMRDPRIRGNVQKLLNRRRAGAQRRNVRGVDYHRAGQQANRFQGRANQSTPQLQNRLASFYRNKSAEQARGTMPKGQQAPWRKNLRKMFRAGPTPNANALANANPNARFMRRLAPPPAVGLPYNPTRGINNGNYR